MIACVSCGKWTPGMGQWCARCYVSLSGEPPDVSGRVALAFVREEEERMAMRYIQDQADAARAGPTGIQAMRGEGGGA